MRKSAIKKINKKVDELLFEWIKKILPEEEQDKVMWDMAESKNTRMKNKLKKQASSGPKGY